MTYILTALTNNHILILSKPQKTMDYETQHFILVALHAGRGMAHAGMLVGRHAHHTGGTERNRTVVQPYRQPDCTGGLEAGGRTGMESEMDRDGE